MPSGPEASDLLTLRMASYTTLGVKFTLVEWYWILLTGKEMTIEDRAVNTEQK